MLAHVLADDIAASLGVSVGPPSKKPVVALDPTMQAAAHIAFLRHDGARRISLSEDVAPLDVDSYLSRGPKMVVATDASLDEFTPARLYTPGAEAEVRAALRRIDARNPDVVNDRSEWLRVLAALKSFGWADALMEPIAREWSKQSLKFDAAHWTKEWGSLKVEGGIKPPTLFYLAGQAEDDCAAFGTDDGHACRWVAWLDGRVMHARGRFYQWTGAFWRPDTGQVAGLLKEFARVQADDAARAFHADPQNKGKGDRMKAARTLLQQNTQDRVLRAAATMLRVEDSDLDRDDYLLSCSNGTVNLLNGTLKPADPLDCMTLTTGHAFDKEAQCPAWESFIAKAIGDKESVEWFQRFIGYCATGSVEKEMMLLTLGPSGSGKSTALKAIMHALGGETATTSYATAAGSALLADTGKQRNPNEHTGGLTPLVGKRLASVNEIKKGERWDDSLLKQLVSREPIQMREVGGARAFNVMPTSKIWVRGNHQPNLCSVGDDMIRRLAILEFKRPPAKADHGLDARFRAEAPGILRWIAEGAVALKDKGLKPLPGVMQEILDSFRSEQDVMGEWLATCYEPGTFTPGEDLRHDYAAWAGLMRHPPSDKAFAAMMKEHGYPPIRYRGKRGFAIVRKRHDDSDFDIASLV